MTADSSSIVHAGPTVREVAWLLLAAAVVRIAMLVLFFNQLGDDPDAYRRIAHHLRDRGSFAIDDPLHPLGDPIATAYRPPLYPVVLAGLASLPLDERWTTGALHLGLGLLTVWFALRAADRAGLGRWSLAAGALIACDPLLLQQSTLVMTETMAACFASALLWCFAQRDPKGGTRSAAFCGVLLGIATLCRPTFLVVAAFIAVAWMGRALFRRRDYGAPLVVAALCAAMLVPWTIRNAVSLPAESGLERFSLSPVPTTTHGGYTLLLGNNRAFYDHLQHAPAGQVWRADDPLFQQQLRAIRLEASMEAEERFGRPVRPVPETIVDRAHYRYALRSISEDPAMFARSTLLRVGWLWSPLAHPRPDEPPQMVVLRFAAAGWYILLFVLAGLGCWTLRRRWATSPWLEGLAMCLALTLLHAFFWSNLRMRAPLMPFVAIVAAQGIAWIGPRLQVRNKRPGASRDDTAPSAPPATGD